MPDLTAGTLVKAGDYSVPVYAFDTTTILNVSSGSYITDSPVVDTTFIAPTTGRVMITVGLQAGDNLGLESLLLAYQVFEGSDATGPLVRGADVGNWGVRSPSKSTNYATWSRCSILDGLKPYEQYYIRTVHRVTGGSSCDLTFRDVMVEPVP